MSAVIFPENRLKSNGKAKPLPVNCVEEEYFFVSLQRCECGGTLQTLEQSLLNDGDVPLDLIKARCTLCDKKREFKFNISAFYGDMTKYGLITRPSQIIDALEWLTLAIFFMRDAEKISGDDGREVMGQANFCFRQLLTFYPEDSQLPTEGAFFNQENAKPPKGRIDLFQRSRIIMLMARTQPQ